MSELETILHRLDGISKQVSGLDAKTDRLDQHVAKTEKAGTARTEELMLLLREATMLFEVKTKALEEVRDAVGALGRRVTKLERRRTTSAKKGKAA